MGAGMLRLVAHRQAGRDSVGKDGVYILRSNEGSDKQVSDDGEQVRIIKAGSGRELEHDPDTRQ